MVESDMTNNNILVLGVGNPFRRDDGVGPAVIRRLQAMFGLEHVDLRDGGTDGLALMDVMQGYERVVVVDAVNMGAPPGTIRVFAPEDARLAIQTDALSTHGFGLPEVLALMQQLGINVPMRIIGIQAGDVSFGEGLSQDIGMKIEELVECVKQEIIEH